MSRRPRVQLPGASYHVVARGNNKQEIFLDARDRHVFIDLIAQTVSRLQWRCLTYCLMPNHYHLVFRTPNADLAVGMRHINSVYAQAFNRRHVRCGHLFHGRYGGHLIESDLHLLASIRYIALNPVRAGLVTRADDWPWSGHAEVCGATRKRLVSMSDLLAHFGSSDGAAFRHYRDFIDGREAELG